METVTDIDFSLYMRNTKTDPMQRDVFCERVRGVLNDAFKSEGIEIDIEVAGGGTEFHYTPEEEAASRQRWVDRRMQELATSKYPICDELVEAVLTRKCYTRTAVAVANVIPTSEQMEFIKAVSKEGFRSVIEILKLGQPDPTVEEAKMLRVNEPTLTVEELAAKLGMSVEWVRMHAFGR